MGYLKGYKTWRIPPVFYCIRVWANVGLDIINIDSESDFKENKLAQKIHEENDSYLMLYSHASYLDGYVLNRHAHSFYRGVGKKIVL